MWVIALAFFVGTLIGMTGSGSGVVLTPLLLILTPYPALTIIGTDVVIGTLTRLLGARQVAGSLAGSVGQAKAA